MKRLKFTFDLDCRVAIYVPSTVDVSEPTNNEKQVKSVITQLAGLFGGATATQAVGGWVCETGETVLESVTIVYSFCTSEQLKEKFAQIYEIAERIKIEMSQEAVTLEINGQVKFV